MLIFTKMPPKRSSDHLTPPPEKSSKKYSWTPENLLTQNRYQPLTNITDDISVEDITDIRSEDNSANNTTENKLPLHTDQKI